MSSESGRCLVRSLQIALISFLASRIIVVVLLGKKNGHNAFGNHFGYIICGRFLIIELF